MTTTTIRISMKTRTLLSNLAGSTGLTMQQVVEEALEIYRRRQFLEETNRAYAALRNDGAAWREVEVERVEWDETLADGLEGV